jgi:hypothetical protein
MRLVLIAIASITSPSIGFAQPAESSNDSTKGLAEVLERLSRIEATQKQILEQLNDRTPGAGDASETVGDFSRVRISVRSDDGRPLVGYRADLRLASKADRPALAKGTSDDAGLAIDRSMPYGLYTLSLKEESGWGSYLSDLVIEVGRPLELEIVAPDPASRGKLVLRSELRKEAFGDLPFGEIRTFAGSGYYVSAAPEPGSAEAKRHPTLNRGIAELAVALSFDAVSRLKQPNGQTLEWRWSPSPSRYLATPSGFRTFAETTSPSARPTDGAEFFSGLGSDEQVGYATFADVQNAGDALELDVPAGSVELNVTEIYGKASPEALKSLDITGKEAGLVWLSVSLQDGSPWPDRIFDANQWGGPSNANYVVSRTITIERDKSVRTTLK